MLDGKQIRAKLVGSDDERAVSPVIGVILMVAITVILAAVIAAFVLDMGSNMGSAPVNAVADSDVDNTNGELTITVEDMGNAQKFELRGDTSALTASNNGVDDLDATGESETWTYTPPSGSGTDKEVRLVAIDGENEQVVETISYTHG
ncbi:type IV pilin [Natrinema hispanicum]|uniref:Flagellin N-terminal-like domain-containing protein n=1 Tax=Natrinema hispanicum TaxID=392421 RepID=A0A1G6UT48_9EURY|nr:type IV pilin N-terminal domain-containing protein [Natrinema hispanicum]SDD44558.1 flagellin N-terminal-like domain-containing protein [Natrinema hispanicum]